MFSAGDMPENVHGGRRHGDRTAAAHFGPCQWGIEPCGEWKYLVGEA